MRITIAAIGKLATSSPEYQLMAEFRKRLPWPVDIREAQVKKPLSEAQLRAAESNLLLDAVPKGAKVIALDERGKTLSSREFARVLQHWQDDGSQQVAFLIGGASGHDEVIYDKADLRLSFGKMTWPHMLVRPMLLEQLYRAYTIQTGHPYHRD